MVQMRASLAFVLAVTWMTNGISAAPYYGKLIGKLSELHHGVSGEVYAVDGRTLYIKDFTYDGQGPAAYFYASSGRAANSAGFRLRDENGNGQVIRRYRKEGITLTLPEGRTLNNIKIFYVWCEEFDVNFGDVKIPRGFEYPRPQKIEPLKGVHAISSDPIVIVDAQTLLIPNLSYDGEAPDAKFWVGRGPKPSPQGIRVADENGKEVPLRRYDRKTVVLTLPGDLTVFDIGHFGIWCEAFTVDFGHVQIPQELNVPPSLKMLGVSPQSKLNCEVLYDDLAFEVRWAIAGDSIVLQLVSKLEDNEYMSFGPSGDDSKTEMIGGDVVVAWVDKATSKGNAQDYYLGAKSQCSGPTGSCPDNRLEDNADNIRLLNAAMVNGYSIVTYQRPLKPSDQYDRQIHTNKSQAILWAIGPLNQRQEVSFHSHYTKGDQFIDFGRAARWNCPAPQGETKATTQILEATTPASRQRTRRPQREEDTKDTEKSATRRQPQRRGRPNATPAPASKRDAWIIPPIQCYEPDDGVFYAQMGPTGGKRGYPAITGHVGWGISWYINGLLIPEINVVRGKTYTFVVEGGFDAEVPAKYHPFYITDDPVGGYEYKTPEERKNVTIYAGAVIAKDGNVKATGVGRLCHWTHQGDDDADDFDSFGAYQRTLELKCDQGEPGVIQWTPDQETPDTVYYQCFTHRYLGWKINVHDSCDEQGSASEQQESIVKAPDLATSPSLAIETTVKANHVFNEDREDKHNTTISELGLFAPIYLAPTPFPFKPIEERTLSTSEAPLYSLKKMASKPHNQSFLPFHLMHRRPIVLRPYYKKPYRPPTKYFIRRPPFDPLDFSESKTKPRKPLFVATTTTTKATTTTTTTEPSLKPAQNTGFKPESIVMESGFKPIITKREYDEPIAEAAERVESYYLPPAGQPPPNIDEPVSPPDVVVTYDGKKVSGASLTARVSDRTSILDQKASKAAEFIKARPQFAPFKGELPPLNPDIINRQAQVLSRNPDVPPKTRLSPVG